MKKSLLKNLALVLLTSFMTLVVVSANPQIYKITAYLNGELKFTFNGEHFQPKDQNGTDLSPIVYKNSTYLPVRALAELTGLEVDYNDKTKTISIEEDLSGAIPYNDSKTDSRPESTKPSYESPKGALTAPKLEGKVENGKLLLTWQKVTDARLQGYKVVISKSDSTPIYPDNGYLYWITDKSQTSTVVDNNNPYNGGDFGKYLIPGETYYFSITVLYDGGKVSTNTVKLKYPAE